MRAGDMFIDASAIRERKKGGIMLSYIEGHRVIQNLNELYDGVWNFAVQEFKTIYSDRVIGKEGKEAWEVGCYCIGRLTIGDKIVFEDIGYGMGTDYSNRLNAEESAGKEAVTDSLKRCAKNLGNYFGLALYDKEQEGVLTMDKEGLDKIYNLASRYCNLETQAKIDSIKADVKAKYKVTMPGDMKPFMWREMIVQAWAIYWDSFLASGGTGE